jgi:hypothetical protein
VKLAVAAVALLSGCAQILGLEETKFDYKDAGADAPGVCDTPAIECTSSTGRSLCGRLLLAGTGAPYTVAAPTAQLCSTTEGPCGLTVFGQSAATYFAGTSADRVMAQVDDCGHYSIPDLDAAVADVAIGIAGPTVATSGRVLFDRMTGVGTDTGVEALVVPIDAPAAWAGQLGIAPTSVETGYLVKYLTSTGATVPMEEVRISGAPVGDPKLTPWAAYFTGPFDALDTTLMSTTMGGAAFIGPPIGTFRIGGFHVGKTCGRDGFQAVSSTLLYVVLKDC